MNSNNTAKSEAVIVPEEVCSSLWQVLDYLWEDEKEDYQGRLPEDREGHLFEALTCISEWMSTAVKGGKSS